MNANYLKASAAVLLSFCAIFGGTPTANAQTELTPKCETPTLDGDPACWLKVDGHDNCYIWIDEVEEEHTVTWSGKCQAGKAQGRGKDTREYVDYAGTKTRNGIGSYLNGKRDGRWKIRLLYSDGSGQTDTGSYVDGKKHGKWVEGREYGPYVDGKKHGQWVEGGSKGPYMNGKRHGLWELRLWVKDGKAAIVLTGPHLDGKWHGQWERRYPDGSKECGEYSNGDEVGDWHDC